MHPNTCSRGCTKSHKAELNRRGRTPQRATKRTPSAAMNGTIRNGVTKRDVRGNEVKRPASKLGVSVPRGIARFNDRVTARPDGNDAPRIDGRFSIASFGGAR
jgi:hypothetical protein